MRRLLVFVCLASCGSLPEAPALRCDPSKPFGTPVRIDGLNTRESSDQDVRVTSDELTLVYARSWPNTVDEKLDLFMSTRADVDAPWSEPSKAPFAALNDLDEQRSPILGDDGLVLFYANYVAGQKYDIVVSRRPDKLAEFGAPAPVAGINAPMVNDRDPWFLPGGDVAYFVSQRDDEASYHVYRAVKSGDAYGSIVMLAELKGPDGEEVVPIVSPDELTIYWSSGRTDLGGLGAADIYRATRTSVDHPFSEPTNVKEVNSSSTDVATWVSADDCVMYLRSERPDNNEFFSDVFVARRPQ